MDVDDGSLRKLQDSQELRNMLIGGSYRPPGWERVLRENEVLVPSPKPNCQRCQGKGSIPIGEGSRTERRRAKKMGLPLWAKFLPCPECKNISPYKKETNEHN